MQFRVLREFERVGPGYEFRYTPGQMIDARMMNWEELIIDKDGKGAYLERCEMEAEKPRRGRPKKVAGATAQWA